MIRLLDRLQEAFFGWGWLSPVVLPLTQLGGRGLFNTLASLYALWGLLSFWRRRERLDRPTLLLYLALLGVFLLTIPGSVDPVAGVRTWLGFLMQSMTLLLIPLALRESPTNPDRLLDGMALFGALTLAGLSLLLPWHLLGLSGQPFDHETQLREDNLPFLTPFLLAWLWRRGPPRWRYVAMVSVVALVLGYIVLAEGRAALLGLIAALTVFSSLVLGWRLRLIALLALLVLSIAIAVNISPFLKMELDPKQPLDAFTAGRTALWRQALAHPPPRAWLGIGMGNGAHAGEEVLGFQLGAHNHQVKHLHNFVLDAWYETGLLGVSLLLALMSTVFVRLLRIWRCLSVPDRQRAGIWLAAAAALLTTGLLSFSYTSRQLACYLFIAFGSLTALSGLRLEGVRPPAVVDKDPDRR
ncbi:MAG: O-antigen ligase family protein [Candidatus Competibacteraceae bacterium]|nr:O-antigen ligase family protein [Candidatus Competibacteraceae bacterium]